MANHCLNVRELDADAVLVRAAQLMSRRALFLSPRQLGTLESKRSQRALQFEQARWFLKFPGIAPRRSQTMLLAHLKNHAPREAQVAH